MHPPSPPPQGSTAETVRLGSAPPFDGEVLARLAAVLEAGALVALPTETVYGFAARADSEEALTCLRNLKGRDPAGPFTWHTSAAVALSEGPELEPLLRRLMDRYWPGPLTLVFHGAPSRLHPVARDGWIGVREQAHPGTRALIEALPFPVVLSSANSRGAAPCSSAEEVARSFSGELAMIADGGPARMGESSAVLQVGRGRFELLREGLLPLRDLRRAAGLRIAFACTGNTCRSPMAEGLARELLSRRLAAPDGPPVDPAAFGFEVLSVGLMAGSGSPAAAHALEVLRGRGIDLCAHRSSPAHPGILGELDLIYGMTCAHVEVLRSLLPPNHAARVQLLDPEGRDVPDPIGGPLEHYAACAEAIEASIEQRSRTWA